MNTLTTLRQKAEDAPDDINGWIDLCEAAELAADYAEVLYAGEHIIRLEFRRPQAHFIRGLALWRLGRVQESMASYRHLLTIDPHYVDAWINLGQAYQSLNSLREAEHAYREAIRASGQTLPDEETRVVDEHEYGSNHWNLALVELLKGDFPCGFAHYRARFKAIQGRARPDFPQPSWRGEDVQGKTVLVTVDQGYGDTLLTSRFLPQLKARGARVLLQAQPALTPLFRAWDGADQVLEWGKDPLPSFDLHASEFDLPHWLGATIENVGKAVPYLPLLPPDENTRLADDGRKKIGLVWSGNPNNRLDAQRSLSVEKLAPLLEMKHGQFFSLNRDLKTGEADMLTHLGVENLAPRLSDFSASARIINQLDLVISCDTAVPHLAGGMGKPVWVMLPFAPPWCWMVGREDSPWYPTARLFRQTQPGVWDDVIMRVKSALQGWLNDAS